MQRQQETNLLGSKKRLAMFPDIPLPECSRGTSKEESSGIDMQKRLASNELEALDTQVCLQGFRPLVKVDDWTSVLNTTLRD